MIARLGRIAAAVLGLTLYTWFGAVRSLPAVKRRKAEKRAARL
jgi:hypothetical protein